MHYCCLSSIINYSIAQGKPVWFGCYLSSAGTKHDCIASGPRSTGALPDSCCMLYRLSYFESLWSIMCEPDKTAPQGAALLISYLFVCILAISLSSASSYAYAYANPHYVTS